MEGQMSIFDFPEYLPDKMTKLVRKNEYEMHHCILCGAKVPCRVLKGKWPNQEYIVTKQCPNCHATVEVDPELLKLEEAFALRKLEKEKLSPAEEYFFETGKTNYWSRQTKEHVELRHPCERKCDVECFSLTCLEKRGYKYDHIEMDWIRDINGNLVREAEPFCDWNENNCIKCFSEEKGQCNSSKSEYSYGPVPANRCDYYDPVTDDVE